MVPAAMPAVTLLDSPANSSATAKMVELAGPKMGGERGRCDGEVVYDNAVRKEGRCGQDDHGRVDCPAHAHRKERVEELIAQTLFDNLLALAFEVHGLDDLGV